MNAPLRFAWLPFVVLATFGPQSSVLYGFQDNGKLPMSEYASKLRASTPDDIHRARQAAVDQCQRTIEDLERHAVGFVLSIDLELQRLKTILLDTNIDSDSLQHFEQRLIRVVPGPDQNSIDALRHSIGEYRRSVLSTESSIAQARQGLAQLDRYSQRLARSPIADPRLAESAMAVPLNPNEEANIRATYEQLHQTNLAPDVLTAIKQSIAYPNAITRLRKRTVESQSQHRFTIPINYSTCQNKATIRATGSVQIQLSAKIPNSQNSIPVEMHVSGTGTIDANVDRSPAHLDAQLVAHANGIQPVVLYASRVASSTPSFHVKMDSRLHNVTLDGHLNRSRVLRKLLSRIAQQQLEHLDQTLPDQIESKAIAHAEEEGYALVYKLNRLLTRGLWDRLETLEFTPTIALSVDSTYISSVTTYARPNQLGALTPPPIISEDMEHQLDATTFVHESAVNNVLQALRGAHLDEATVRGIWNVQLKMTRDEWELPSSAKIPATIMLSESDPVEFRWVDHAAEFTLPLVRGTMNDNATSLPACTVQIRYRLATDAERFSISRDSIALPDQLSADERQSWLELLDRFFPESLQAIPRYRSSSWKGWVSPRYWNATDGWLTIGIASDTSPKDQSTLTATGAKP